jgi:hypothetical protein
MVWNLRAPDRASRDEARLFSRALLFPRERRRAGDVRETLAVDELTKGMLRLKHLRI